MTSDAPSMPLPTYDPARIETELQAHWQAENSYRAVEDPRRKKFYCLSMFPYPSGRLHIGHVRNYTIGDVISRYQRMQGYNVLQPMGWDAFGLPAENAAIDNQLAPSRWTRDNIATMRAQLKRLGFGYDWSRELCTCDPSYYRWEQWFFCRLLEKGLVYRKQALVNWDPVDQTVLANEQVIDGCGWRSGAPVQQREIPQWFLRITTYADELLEELQHLSDWPESVRNMQRNWIGRSRGLEIDFSCEDSGEPLQVYTTRPDTLMGVSYMAVAPQHPLARQQARQDAELAAFLQKHTHGAVNEAAMNTVEKCGRPLGIHAIHPVSGEQLPIWVANFVLMSYGTGAVMCVPAHDQRDWEFARLYQLPIRQVVYPEDGSDWDLEAGAYTAYGRLRNAGDFDGLDFDDAFTAIAAQLRRQKRGRERIQYRLRDWGISRQRYWGCPIPAVYGEDEQPEPAPELPVILPEDVVPDGKRSPLAGLADFVSLTHPDGRQLRRETDTFDTFFESSWYYARFCCPDAHAQMLDERANYWLPVDQYIGGIEHGVLHLLYARCFHKLLRDAGLVDCDEPFTRLLTQGMVLNGGVKMSKSLGNTVDPQEYVDRYGADTVRLYLLFSAPPEQSMEWSDERIVGAHRFLNRLWRIVHAHVAATPATTPDDTALATRRLIHRTIAKVNDDIGRRHMYNTAIAAVMELLNALARLDDAAAASRQEGLETAVLLLAPVVPHITDALWHALGHTEPLLDHPWPVPDPALLVQDTMQIVIQVDGRLRASIVVPANITEAGLREQALSHGNVRRHMQGRKLHKFICVPGKLVNIVLSPS